MPGGKRFVYVLKSGGPNPNFYIGLTSDVSARLADHNAGRCPTRRATAPGNFTSPSNCPTSNELWRSSAI
ncbi:hypothetical protein LuPra_05752 [Luteitalea pratensis]|uniref:GIY-YIG domain-containing protein n=1 Tax=Luteitalea pratensis TaxID=1855912 RepID=A0A143PW17_LUTPR|nr:hypothetical protein LuPra_05752 [Luteitalea pratensis]